MDLAQDHFSFYSFLVMLGGLSVFLYGMDLMSDNLKKVAGDGLKIILQKLTKHRIYGILVGTIVTAIIQSSSATTTILVSLVQSGLIEFERTVAIIMGANIGTTITAQIVAFKITKWSLPIIFLGFIVYTLSKRTKNKDAGLGIMGLGMLFLGLAVMSEAMRTLRSSDFFLTLMQNLENPLLGVFVGAIFTALIQSSSATLGIMIGMASGGLISIEAAVPITFGANLGTCVTAILASLKASNDAKRVAAAHIIFNTGGVLLFVFWIPEFISFVKQISPGADISRLIANSQTLFNVAATLVWFPFVKQLQQLAYKVIPNGTEKKNGKYKLVRPSSFVTTPELALLQSKNAIQHMKNLVKDMLFCSRSYLMERSHLREAEIAELRDEQKELRTDILDYLSRLSRQKLSYDQTSDILNQIAIVNEIEHVAYKLEVSLERMAHKIPNFTSVESAELQEYFKQTVKYFSRACNAFINESLDDCKKRIYKLEALKSFENDFRAQILDHINEKDSQDLQGPDHAIDQANLEVLEILKSINSTSIRIAQILIDEHERIQTRK